MAASCWLSLYPSIDSCCARPALLCTASFAVHGQLFAVHGQLFAVLCIDSGCADILSETWRECEERLLTTWRECEYEERLSWRECEERLSTSQLV